MERAELSPSERRLADIWSDVLHAPAPTAQDNFFVLGGSSLKAMQVVTRVRREFGQQQFSLADMFSVTTLGELAELLDRAQR